MRCDTGAMEPSHPTPDPSDEHDDRPPPYDEAPDVGDVFSRWGSGALLLFTAVCLFLYELWIALLWWGNPALGPWGLALAPLLGVLLPVSLVLRGSRVPKRAQLWLYGLSRTQLAGTLLAAFGVVPVSYAAAALNATWAPPDPEYFEPFQNLAPTDVVSAVGGFLAVVVCVPLGEEIIFRFLVLGVLARHVHAVAAVVAAGVLFAAAHVAPFVLLPIGVLGVVLGLLTVWSRTLTAAWIGHAVFNLFGYIELCVTGDAQTAYVEEYVLQPPVLIAGTVMLVAGLALLRSGALAEAHRDGLLARTPMDAAADHGDDHDDDGHGHGRGDTGHADADPDAHDDRHRRAHADEDTHDV